MFPLRILRHYDPRLIPLMLCIMAVNVLAALDQTSLAVVMPKIRGDLQASGGVAWVITAYMMALTISAPLFGKLSDVRDRRVALLLAVGLFTGASALCGLSQSLPELVAARVVQGIGAAGLFTLPGAILADEVSGRDRGKYQIFISVTWLTLSLSGPALGGFLSELWSWRLLFWVNVPVGGLTMVLILHSVPVRRSEGAGRMRLISSCVLSATVLSWLMLVHQAAGGAGRAVISTAFAAALLCTSLLITHEARSEHPMIPKRLLLNRDFSIGMFVILMLSACQLGVLLYLPLYLQDRFQISATEAGVLMGPALVISPLTVIASGIFLQKTGRYRILTQTGTVLLCSALLALAACAQGLGAAGVAALACGISVGASMAGPMLLIGLQQGLARSDVGLATSMYTVFRNFGGTLGVAFVAALVVQDPGATEQIGRGFMLACLSCALLAFSAAVAAFFLKNITLPARD